MCQNVQCIVCLGIFLLYVLEMEEGVSVCVCVCVCTCVGVGVTSAELEGLCWEEGGMVILIKLRGLHLYFPL